MLASAHSEFVLDGIAPRAVTRYLPSIYQVAFKPLYWLYKVAGAEFMQRFRPDDWEVVLWSQMPAYALVTGLLVTATVSVISKAGRP